MGNCLFLSVWVESKQQIPIGVEFSILKPSRLNGILKF